MALWDLLLTGIIVAVAVWYLYRKLVVQKGCSCGSGCRGSQAAKKNLSCNGGCGCDKKA